MGLPGMENNKQSDNERNGTIRVYFAFKSNEYGIH